MWRNGGTVQICMGWGFVVMLPAFIFGAISGAHFNPARDIGPRFAHAILPIKGKGPSNWDYAIVPVIGPILGGLVAVGLYALVF